MRLTNSKSGWGLISQCFHWLVALLIFIAIALGLVADSLANSPFKIKLFIAHKSIGITVLVLVLARLLWVLMQPHPSAASQITPVNHRLSKLGHALLYILMLLLPLSGWVLNTAANFPFKWMNWFAVPDLPSVPPDWKDPAIQVHWYLFLLLAVTVCGHAVMALWHHRHHSDVLQRMLPLKPGRFFSGFLLALLIVSGGLIYNASYQAPTTLAVGASTPSVTAAPQQNIEHTPMRWQIVADQSQLAFVGEYDGLPFDGEFKRFEADLYFDPSEPEKGFFDVTIDTASVTTYSEDWDGSLLDPEWFFTSQFPEATYQTRDFRAEDECFIADGVLTLKGISKPVALKFSWKTREDGLVDFEAKAIVKRTDFAIGDGEWAADNTIAFDVTVDIELSLKPVQ